jgi:hypothetical protein
MMASKVTHSLEMNRRNVAPPARFRQARPTGGARAHGSGEFSTVDVDKSVKKRRDGSLSARPQRENRQGPKSDQMAYFLVYQQVMKITRASILLNDIFL